MQKSLSFWDNFYALFVTDDKARWKMLGWIVAVGGVFGSIDVAFLNSSINDVVFFLSAWVVIAYFGSIAWYCSFRPLRKSEPASFSRRLIIQAAVATVAFILTLGIPRAEARILDRKLREAARNPLNPKNIQEARTVISKALAAGIRAAPTAVEQAGVKFAFAGTNNPEAWNTALQFLAYKSFLNTTLTIVYRQIGTAGEITRTRYNSRTPPGLAGATFGVLGAVPFDEAAQFSYIGEPDFNAGSTRGNDWIIVEGGGVILDGVRLRKVVFNNVYLSYIGGSLEMHEVYFFNCTFSIERKPNGVGLLTAALEPRPATSFIAS